MEIPLLYGLVLAGGASKRMGADKSRIVYRDKEHRLWLYELLRKSLDRVFLSVKKIDPSLKEYEQIADSVDDRGPIVALLTAFKKFPNASFLVLACDLPYIDHKTIQLLKVSRDPKKQATSLQSVHKDYPEPLVAIWERDSYQILKKSYEEGMKCPRRILQSLDARIITLENDRILENVNTPDERERVDQ